jgi:hypothetical protein
VVHGETEKPPCGIYGQRCENNIKTNSKETGSAYGGLNSRLKVITFRLLKSRELLDLLSNYQLLKKSLHHAVHVFY